MPSEYTEEAAGRICEEIASGRSLRSICKDEDMPAASTVFLWLSKFPSFSEQYTRAREAQAESMAEDILDIADDGTNDYAKKVGADGSTSDVLNAEHIQRSRLRVDARKWLMAKMAPKKYGEKLDMNLSGSVQTMPQEAVDARIAELLGKAGVGATSGGAGKAEGEE